jgi:DegV family protein with EDD domain
MRGNFIMSRVAIVSDSTCDLPVDYREKYNINVVPLSIIFGDERYIDNGSDISVKQFYEKLSNSTSLPTTAQPSPGDFLRTYDKLLKTHRSIISIHISKKMSGTVDSAEMAKKQLSGRDITVIDSGLVQMPLGFTVLKAAAMAAENKNKDEIMGSIEKFIEKLHSLFVPATLEYLRRGGRIGRARFLVASLLEIKPILTLNLGEVSQFKTTRRWKQAKNEMIKTMESTVKNGNRLVVSVCDSDVGEEGDIMAERIRKTFNPSELIRGSIGCIVGTHLGPGAIAIAYYEKE